MRMKTIFVSMLATLALVGCSNEDDSIGNEVPSGDLKGYISISIPTQSRGQSRAETGPADHDGSAAESQLQSAHIILCDEMRVIDSEKFKLTVADGQTGTHAVGTMKVSASSKYAFVIVNTPDDVAEKIKKGALMTDIQGTLDGAALTHVATDGNFMMTSAGAYTDANTMKGLTPITAHVKETETLAKDAPLTIEVDRVVAKISVSTDISTMTKPEGTEFTLTGWMLNVTNKKFNVYTSLVDFGGKADAKYREDANYDEKSLPVFGATDYTAEMNKNFDILTNPDTDDRAWEKSTGSKYCFENTMAEDQQLVDRSTNVIFKAVYFPKGFTKGKSYFKYEGVLYTFEQISAMITATDDDGNLVNAGLVADADILAEKVFGSGTWKDNVSSLKSLDDIPHGGSKGEMCSLRYYQEGVNYYRGIIKHDNRLGTLALGKFGVVRNNFYSLSIASISGEGEPWIPGPVDPETPDKPKPDEDKDAYISVQITVNPWTMWSQGFEM